MTIFEAVSFEIRSYEPWPLLTAPRPAAQFPGFDISKPGGDRKEP